MLKSMGLGRLDVKHLVMLRKIKFYRHLFLHIICFIRDVFCDPNSDCIFGLHQLLSICLDFI